MDGFDTATGEIMPPLDYQTSANVDELFAALAKAQGKIKNAARDSQNPHFRSKYADLASVSDACRQALSENGIAVVQIPHNDGEDIGVTTILGHASGQWIKGKIKVAPAKWDAQGIGSVTTYLRRYSLAAMAGVAPGDDDDGEAAVGRGNGNGNAAMAAPKTPPNGKRTAPPRDAESPEVAEARALYRAITQRLMDATTFSGVDAIMASEAKNIEIIRRHAGADAASKLAEQAELRKDDLRVAAMQ